MDSDLHRYRSEFPVTERCVYLNHASEGPHPRRVTRAVQEFLEHSQCPTQDHSPRSFQILREIRERLAALLGAKPAEIGISDNTSYGINVAAQGLDWQPGENVVLSSVEFPANVYPWLNLRRRGVEIRFAKSRDGFTRVEDLIALADGQTRAIAVSLVQFFNGYQIDMAALGRFCRQRKIFSAIDGMQGVGVLDLDVKKAQVDLLSAGGAKWLLSPHGVGFFYVADESRERLHPSFTGWLSVDWGAHWSDLLDHSRPVCPDARQFETGTYAYPSLYGFHSALGLLGEIGLQRIEQHCLALTGRLIAYLRESPYRLKSCLEPAHRSAIISFAARDNERLYAELRERNFVVSLREGGMRVSPHFYNTTNEIDALIETLQELEKTVV